MEQYIPKAAVVAEIERLVNNYDKALDYEAALEDVRNFLDTLEVKEVDLQSEIDRVWDNTSDNFSVDGWKEFEDITKHFFELGLKTKRE